MKKSELRKGPRAGMMSAVFMVLSLAAVFCGKAVYAKGCTVTGSATSTQAAFQVQARSVSQDQEAETEAEAENSDLRFVFVHGLSGWGSYDDRYKLMPYWGMFGGDLIRYLNEQGYPSYAASVAPEGSAWDRACELYAQLTGSVVD